MLRYPIPILTALALISPVFASWTPAPSPAPNLDQQGTILRPIHPIDLRASSGIERRVGVKDLNWLKPVNQSQLVWGASVDDNTLFLANLTLHAPDGLSIVSLERFDHLIGNIKCTGLNDMIKLTFASTQAFEKAELEWKFVNENDGGRFLFITDGLRDGCGIEGQRNPFVISTFTNDRTTLTTSLTARAVNWADVAGSYEMDFGHQSPVPQAHQLKRDWLDGNYNRNHSSNFSISAGTQGLRKNIYTNHDAGLSLDCMNCFIAGSFLVQSHVEVKDYKLQDLVLTASPHSLSAALELEATITTTDNPQGLSFSYPLLRDVSIPYAGFSIDDLVSVGASLSYYVGGSCTFSGDAVVDFGVNATVPVTAQIVADFHGQAASSVTGFDANDLRHSFHIGNESATVSLNAYSQPELKFEFELVKVAEVDVTLTVKLPELNASFTAESDANGACNSSASGIKTEILIDSSASIEVDIDFDAGLHKEDAKTPLWSAHLYSTSKPLPSACYPLDIPHLTSPSATTVPSLSASLSMSTAFSGDAAVPTPSLGPGGLSSVAGLGSLPSLQGGSSGARPSVGMTSIPTPTYSMTSSGMNASTTVSSIVSGGTDTGSTSTSTTLSTSVKAKETSSPPSSSTSEDSEMTSLTASGISTIVSNTRSSSPILSLPTSTGTGKQAASMGTTLSTFSTVKVPSSWSSSALEISSGTASSISSSLIATDSTSKSYSTTSPSLETTSSMTASSPTSELSSTSSLSSADKFRLTSARITPSLSSNAIPSSISLSVHSSTTSTPSPNSESTSSLSPLSHPSTSPSSMSLTATSPAASKPSPPPGSIQGTSSSSETTSSVGSSSSHSTSVSPSGTSSSELSTFVAMSSTTSSLFGTATSSLSSEISISSSSPLTMSSTVLSSSSSSKTTDPSSVSSSIHPTLQSSSSGSETVASSDSLSSIMSISSTGSPSSTVLPTTKQVSSPTTTEITASSRSQSSDALSIGVSVASQSNQANAISSQSSVIGSASIESLTTISSSTSQPSRSTNFSPTSSQTSTIETTSSSISTKTQSVSPTSSTTRVTEKSTTTPVPTIPSPSPAITSPSTPITPKPIVTPEKTTHPPSQPQPTHENDSPAASICKRGRAQKAAAPAPTVNHNIGGFVSKIGNAQHASASAGCEDDV